jgi:hypothetical protein
VSRRKRDDLESGYLFRVVQRAKGSEDEWQHSNYGTSGKPRTYMTLGAARAQRTSFEREHARHLSYQAESHRYNPDAFAKPTELEFAVQRAPVTAWEVIPDGP